MTTTATDIGFYLVDLISNRSIVAKAMSDEIFVELVLYGERNE